MSGYYKNRGKVVRLALVFAIFTIFLYANPQGGEKLVWSSDLVWPVDRNVYDNRYATIVVRKGNSLDRVAIIINDRPAANRKITPKTNIHEEFVCLTVELMLGENRVEVLGFDKEDRKVLEKSLTLYQKSILQKKFRYPPKEYHKTYFHNERFETPCADCHDMSVNEVKGVAFEDIEESNCFICHKSVMFEKYMHAPAANWLCATSCHNGQSGRFNEKFKGASKFIYPDPIAKTCFECHEKFEKRFKKEKYRHEPVDDGRCNKCHNPHGGNDKKFLRYQVWYLCTTCHTEKKSKPHVVTTFSSRGHPTKGKKLPNNPNEELTCVSCHNPHVSNNGFMLRDYMGEGLMLWCNKCHKK